MKLKQIFNRKYKNRIINKIRELEIEQLKIKLDKSRVLESTNTKEYARLWCIQQDIEKDIELLKSLLK